MVAEFIIVETSLSVESAFFRCESVILSFIEKISSFSA